MAASDMAMSYGMPAMPPGMMPPMGDQQGGQQGGSTLQNVAEIGPENPSKTTPDEQFFTTSGVSDLDQKKLMETISDYRQGWAQDRLERIRQWEENLLYWKGTQVIEWDNATNGWYDVLSWARNQGADSGEDTDLERWINPLTLMFCNVFTATMSRTVPRSIVKPKNADAKLQDTVTAKAAVEAIGIIEQQNEIRKMIRTIYEYLFLMGCYFRYTRPVVDGKMFGYDEVARFEDMNIQQGPHYTCTQCGTETPATSPDGMACPVCGAFMGQESYYAAGEGSRTSLRQSGTKKIPRAGVKWSLHGPLEIDVDPTAKGDRPLDMTPILAKDCEIDFGEACMMFPLLREKLQPGAETSTTPNASFEKIARLNALSALGGVTADNTLTKPTYSEVWMQPMSYYKLRDWAFGDRMKAKFPDGLKISTIGETVVDIRAAVLTKEWSHAALYTNQGVYCAALANTAVSFNARFNRVMWILDDWASRAALGLNLADASRLDTEKMSGKQVPAGTIVPIPMKFDGIRVPISEVMMHYDLPINPALWNYPMMLMTFCELILGIPRQLSGQGTQDDVETLGGQQLQLARAATTLKPYFENVQDESARASQNAIECLQILMKSGAVKEIQDVVESRGGAFQNNRVDWQHMQGNVNIVMDEDQDLPVSPDELRTAIQTMFTELSKGNVAAQEWFDIPENQDLALSTMLPGSVLPNEAQELKTEADIQTIIEQGMQPTMNPDGSIGAQLPVHPGKHENFPIAKQVLQRYMNEHFEMRTDDVMSWNGLNAYYDEIDAMDQQVAQKQAGRQLAVTQAGQPKPPAPDPGTMAAVQELQKLAVQMADQLAKLSMVDPLVTKQTITGQVSAGKEIIDSAMDATKAMQGDK